MIRFVVGGNAYRMQVDGRVAGSIAALAALSINHYPSTPLFSGVCFQHTSNLWQGRSMWLQTMIDDPSYHLAVTVDSDTNFDPERLLLAMATEFDIKSPNSKALAIVPVREGSGGSNMRLDGLSVATERDHAELSQRSSEIVAGGLALAVYDLRWFRMHMPKPRPIYPSWGAELGAVTHLDGLARPLAKPGWLGEDMALCLSIRARGGKIYSLPAGKTKHYAFEGK